VAADREWSGSNELQNYASQSELSARFSLKWPARGETRSSFNYSQQHQFLASALRDNNRSALAADCEALLHYNVMLSVVFTQHDCTRAAHSLAAASNLCE
jgi:hypothetical protein